jgi:hypothetical protein
MNTNKNPKSTLTGIFSCVFAMVVAWLMVFPAFGQQPETNPISQQAIEKLAFLSGEWKGTGWIMAEDGNRYEFDQTELVQLKLDGTALLIEGRGMSDGKVIHDALAVVTYNQKDKNYSFMAWLSNREGGEYRGELIDNFFYWYPGDNIRYIIYLNEKGQWYEKGEYNTGGGNWFQFFEMTLDKVK